MKSKLLRLQESLGDNEQLTQKFVETFSDISDSDENAPEVDVMVEQFCDENGVELKEAYDISSLNLKKGTVLELTDLEDALNLTGGKFRKELSLYYNDNGFISVQVLKDGQNTVNGVTVSVKTEDGDSSLAGSAGILKAIKDHLENGDLSHLLEDEEDDVDTGVELEKMSTPEMVSNLTEDEYRMVESMLPVRRKQKLVEAMVDMAVGNEVDPLVEEEIEDVVSPLFSIETPENMTRTTEVDSDTVSGLLESKRMRAEGTSRKGIFLLKESDGSLAGVYNANTEELDTVSESELEKGVEQSLTEASEKVRVPKNESDKFTASLKSQGTDFSRSSSANAPFDDFYINDLKKEDVKKIVKEYMDNGGRAVLVERMKEDEDTGSVPTKQYADVIVENANGEVLLLQRTDDDALEPSKFGFAGGKIEEGEDAEAGAIRELKEETGLECSEITKLAEYENPDGSVSHYYKAKLDEDADITLSDEHQSSKWVSPESLIEADDIIFDNNDRYAELCNEPVSLTEGELQKALKGISSQDEKWAENELLNGKPQGVLNRVADRLATSLGYISKDGSVNDEKGYQKVIGEVFRIGYGKNKNLKESENALEVGSTVKDKDGNDWKVESVDGSGFKLVGDAGEKILPFDEVDTFINDTKLTESRKPVSVRRLRESIDRTEVESMIESDDVDGLLEESEDVPVEDVPVEEMTPIGETEDAFGDTIKVVESEDGSMYAVELEKE